ncbi:hypothetical protein BABINDRAFT_8554 [Babjeviella inositovora NRRL Y-12698]|uniref:Phosphatidylserine decarboxylase proenzyme 1, mitochondrial n=1 Tax=Babjeviella inositovora NRRL Y-12698 TaxID=984486 RepID=A0A1E3QPN9_9ASCO|nr:uncharacterized protein BABINDRAFT_8554 [Babjeviella inositovora NRRL Y-12698]ODQ79655.1 hypothetical protein BABINDRAFT_8554 [Babjeviella inositovora NRRL Y-12698]
MARPAPVLRNVARAGKNLGYTQKRSMSTGVDGPLKDPVIEESESSDVSPAASPRIQPASQRWLSYYYSFPRIPRPKRSVLYYSTWSGGASSKFKTLKTRISTLSKSKRKMYVPFSLSARNLNRKFRGRFFFSTSAHNENSDKVPRSRRQLIKWWTLSSLSIILTSAGVVASRNRDTTTDENQNASSSISPQSWKFYAYSTLPLKGISRLWGLVNSLTLPVWLRAPSYKFYSYCFGVNLNEMEDTNLREFKNLGEFFYRRLKPGVRTIGDSDLVSPADGKVLKFGIINNGEIEQVKGMTYSVDALLGTNDSVRAKLAAPSHAIDFNHPQETEVFARHKDFAELNGILYTLDDLIGGGNNDDANINHHHRFKYEDKGDKTALGDVDSLNQRRKESTVARDLVDEAEPTHKSLKKSGNKDTEMFFAVIYLAPGDYHRYHSPANWVTTLRRHFIGELFSVAPYFQKTLNGLFVLNERVALLGYWKYGFFSMIPVGATNVGSIIVNFDKDLKTNDIYEHEVYSKSELVLSKGDDSYPSTTSSTASSSTSLSSMNTTTDSEVSESTSLLGKSARQRRKRLSKNTVYEATYTQASELLGGVPLVKGQEVGGFKLGSTVVLVFEAPKSFKFNITNGQKIKMGESIGEI